MLVHNISSLSLLPSSPKLVDGAMQNRADVGFAQTGYLRNGTRRKLRTISQGQQIAFPIRKFGQQPREPLKLSSFYNRVLRRIPVKGMANIVQRKIGTVLAKVIDSD